jgi:hypothetical protein
MRLPRHPAVAYLSLVRRMKRWLYITTAVLVGFILGALFGRQYLTHPTPHELQLMHIASAQRARNTAEANLQVLQVLEDFGADPAKDVCSTQLAFYYKMFADADDTNAPGQSYLLNQIKEDSEKWPELKREFEKWKSRDVERDFNHPQ